MSLKFTTTKLASAQEAYSLQKLELLNATEALNSSWMDLTEAQREIDDLQEIMDNVHKSVEMLNQFGADAIPMLNADGGLEALLQIPERLITVEKAQEGLGETARNVWEAFKKALEKIFGSIVNFFKTAMADDVEMLNKINHAMKMVDIDPNTECHLVDLKTLEAFESFWADANKIIKRVNDTGFDPNKISTIEVVRGVLDEANKLATSRSFFVDYVTDTGKFSLARSDMAEDGTLSKLGFDSIENIKRFADLYEKLGVSRQSGGVLSVFQRINAKLAEMVVDINVKIPIVGGSKPESMEVGEKGAKLYLTLTMTLSKCMVVMYNSCRRTMIYLSKLVAVD